MQSRAYRETLKEGVRLQVGANISKNENIDNIRTKNVNITVIKYVDVNLQSIAVENAF